MRTLARLALVPAAAAALLAACGSSGSASPATTAAAVTSAATTAPPVPPTTAAPAGANTTQAPPAAPERPSAGDVAQIDVKVGVNDSRSRVENVALNQRVVITLVSDNDEEYHLHGYELEKKVAAGNEWTFDFTATKAGFFPLESHTSDSVLLVLHVS